MKALIFSDIHSDLKALARLLETEADYYIAAGDMVSWQRGLDKVGEVLARRAEQVYVLPGNHERARDIEALCARYGLHPFHRKSIEADGYHIAGLGYSNPTPFYTPGEYSETELAEHLAPFADKKPLILVCHCPPRNTELDRAGPDRHFGSSSIREFIEQEQPAYFFCGHIHEAEGAIQKLGATTCVNVGKRGYLLDFDKID